MQSVLGNTVTIDSVLERPEWGGDGEVHINSGNTKTKIYTDATIGINDGIKQQLQNGRIFTC